MSKTEDMVVDVLVSNRTNFHVQSNYLVQEDSAGGSEDKREQILVAKDTTLDVLIQFTPTSLGIHSHKSTGNFQFCNQILNKN